MGMGTSDNFENKKIDDSVKKEIKIGSNLQTVGKVLHYSGAFKNTGMFRQKSVERLLFTPLFGLWQTM